MQVMSAISTGKELTIWLFACLVLLYNPTLLFVLLSRLVFVAGCEIRLYRFLIIFLFKVINNLNLTTIEAKTQTIIFVYHII